MRDVAQRLAPILLFAGLWVALSIAVPPAETDFPYNDDWAYARGAFAFALGEGIHYYGWPAFPLLGQWFWAVPFVHLLGESHVVLRLSTILLALLALESFRMLLREAGVPPARASFAACVLAVEPLFLVLSGTYMSDVPTLGFEIAALACLARGETREAATPRWAGFCLAALGVLNRQCAAAVPLAALAFPGVRRRGGWTAALLALALVAAALHFWARARPDQAPVALGLPSLKRIALIALYTLHSAGLAAAPLLLLAPRPGRRRVFLGGCLVLGAFALERGARGLVWPYVGNNLNADGAFVSLLGAAPILLGPAFRLAVTVVGVISGAALVARIDRAALRSPAACALGLYALLHIGLNSLTAYPWDRYSLPIYPFGLLLAARPSAAAVGLRHAAGLALLAAIALFSTAFVHDHLAWNAARWALGRRAVASGIDPQAIEGGFEWDGTHAPAGVVHGPAEARGLALPHHVAYFPGMTGRYALSFTPLPGGTVVDSEPYRYWLAPGERRILLVAADDSSAGAAVR